MNFKELLAKNNLRQRDLLKYPSFNRSVIGNWCSGYRRPTLESIVELSKCTGIGIEEIIYSLIETKKERKEIANAYRRWKKRIRNT